MDLSILVPALDDRALLAEALPLIFGEASASGLEWELLVVDDTGVLRHGEPDDHRDVETRVVEQAFLAREGAAVVRVEDDDGTVELFDDDRTVKGRPWRQLLAAIDGCLGPACLEPNAARRS